MAMTIPVESMTIHQYGSIIIIIWLLTMALACLKSHFLGNDHVHCVPHKFGATYWEETNLPSGKHLHSCGKSPRFMGTLTNFLWPCLNSQIVIAITKGYFPFIILWFSYGLGNERCETIMETHRKNIT